jgi:hypothetical protein
MRLEHFQEMFISIKKKAVGYKILYTAHTILFKKYAYKIHENDSSGYFTRAFEAQWWSTERM